MQVAFIAAHTMGSSTQRLTLLFCSGKTCLKRDMEYQVGIVLYCHAVVAALLSGVQEESFEVPLSKHNGLWITTYYYFELLTVMADQHKGSNNMTSLSGIVVKVLPVQVHCCSCAQKLSIL